MADNYNETDLIQGINTNLNFVKNVAVEQADKCVGSIRSALEYSVKLFWLKKYDKKPVWVKGYTESFDLHKAVVDERFSQYFNEIVLGDMHIIRKTCNAVMHENAPLTLEDAKELLVRLEKCVKAIETAIPMKIMLSPMQEIKNTIIHDNTLTQKTVENGKEKMMVSTAKSYDSNSEQMLFWKMFQDALDNNGNPFTIATRAQYGTVNRKSPNCNLCLGFDFLLQKGFFRIGIYVQDDTQTPCFDRLLRQKMDIEAALGFAPIWTMQGVKNPNTRRIETQLSFTPYDREDYERLIEQALPIFMQYIEVFSKFLPEAFEDKQTYGGQKAMSSSVIIGNSLKRNLTNGYGGSAQPIYDECCDRYGWDRSQRYLFGKQQILYAEGATPEGYSPWFLVHSNLTETKGGNWSNKILQDTIEELWEKPQYGLYHDETTRVTFAKTKSYGYVFIGIYKPIGVNEKILSDGSKVWIKTYQRIADTYPVIE